MARLGVGPPRGRDWFALISWVCRDHPRACRTLDRGWRPISWGYGVREEGAAIMAPKFDLFKDEDGKFRFRLKADDGEIIVASQGYASKAAATAGIESVMKNA